MVRVHERKSKCTNRKIMSTSVGMLIGRCCLVRFSSLGTVLLFSYFSFFSFFSFSSFPTSATLYDKVCLANNNMAPAAIESAREGEHRDGFVARSSYNSRSYSLVI